MSGDTMIQPMPDDPHNANYWVRQKMIAALQQEQRERRN